jgi:LacI family transcriptional regulator, galactose operon repressor
VILPATLKRFKAPRGGGRLGGAGRAEVTIRDVAGHAGVAVGTVSNYLNGSAPLAEATARRVQRAIDALGYRVHLAARSLRSRRTQSVGLVLPNISNPFYAEVARAIEHALWDRGFQTLLCDSSQDAERERMHLEALESRRVDGILMIRTADWRLPRSRVLHPRVPIVFVDRSVDGMPSVTSDNRLGGELAARHLAQLGHRAIAILAGENAVGNVRERLDGFRAELARHGVTVAPRYLATGPQAIELGREVSRWVKARPRPTAVFATNDIVAIGAWRQLVGMGVRIPADLSLIGFDDIEMSNLSLPPLTTIRQDKAALGREATAVLLELLAGTAPRARPTLIPPSLVVRGSTGPPPASPRAGEEERR